MKRFRTKIEDDVLYLEEPEGWLEIGSFDDIYCLVGGREYTIEYDEEATKVPWLQTDDDHTITFDVRETLDDMTYRREVVENLREYDMEHNDEGYPRRTAMFADFMTQVWRSRRDNDGK